MNFTKGNKYMLSSLEMKSYNTQGARGVNKVQEFQNKYIF